MPWGPSHRVLIPALTQAWHLCGWPAVVPQLCEQPTQFRLTNQSSLNTRCAPVSWQHLQPDSVRARCGLFSQSPWPLAPNLACVPAVPTVV